MEFAIWCTGKATLLKTLPGQRPKTVKTLTAPKPKACLFGEGGHRLKQMTIVKLSHLYDNESEWALTYGSTLRTYTTGTTYYRYRIPASTVLRYQDKYTFGFTNCC
jgi:hypothetical protein